MSCDTPEHLGRLIYFTAQEVKNFAEKILKPHDLTLEQFHLLKHMSRESGMSQRQLGELSNKTPANITRILDRLELKKLIKRQNSAQDRRTTLVFLSKQGENLKMKVFTTFESFSSQLTQGISTGEQEQTRKVLDRIGRNIQKMATQL